MKKTIAFIILLTMVISSFAAVAALAANDDRDGTYVVFGDSIAAGYGLYDTDMNYVADRDSIAYAGIVSRALNFDLDNFAKSGATTSDLLDVLDRSDVLEAVANADLITVSIGGNDMLALYTDILALALQYSLFPAYSQRTDSEVEAMYTTLEDNLTEIMQTLVDTNDGKGTIMLQLLYNPFYSYELPSSYNVGQLIEYYIDRINEIYQNVYEKVDGFVLVDTKTPLNADADSFYDVTTPDIHPTAHGHELIANEILSLYDKIISGTHENEETSKTEETTALTEPTRIDQTTDENYTTDQATTASTEATTASAESTTASETATTAETETTAAEITETAQTSEATTAPTTATTSTKSTTATTATKVTIFDSLGCSSTMGGGIAVTLIVSALACAVISKKGKK